MAWGLQQDHCYTQSVFQVILWQENVMEVHDWETLGEHNLNIITQWGKRKTVILLALKHSIIQKTWSIICMLNPTPSTGNTLCTPMHENKCVQHLRLICHYVSSVILRLMFLSQRFVRWVWPVHYPSLVATLCSMTATTWSGTSH